MPTNLPERRGDKTPPFLGDAAFFGLTAVLMLVLCVMRISHANSDGDGASPPAYPVYPSD